MTIDAMTHKDRQKWDARHLIHPGSSIPAEIVKRFCHLAAPGRALDIACGNGRNSIFLSQNGFAVDAVDVSRVATDRLAAGRPGIQVICADLDIWKIPGDRYSLVVNIRFLDRRLFPMIRDSLVAGGILIFESFVGCKHAAYCLAPNELLRAFQSMHILYYEEKPAEHGEKFDQIATLVAAKSDPVESIPDSTRYREDVR
jgi:SAM-dependent methyltransferase